MKIWCDVCGKEEATVFCSADEAALCNGCDGRVHYANKLASKHLRFSLVNPQYQESPLCDICQEKRALLFCQEDRAILCRECDVPIHEANEHTQKHNRFVLTGVKLSPYSSLYPKNPSSSTNSTLTNDHFSKITNKSPASSSSNLKKSPTDQILIHHSSPHDKTLPLTYNYNYNYNYDYDNNNNKAVDDDPHNNNNIEQQQQQQLNHTSDDGSVSTSSLTEYLMETLPGWQVEDLLDPSSSPNGFYF